MSDPHSFESSLEQLKEMAMDPRDLSMPHNLHFHLDHKGECLSCRALRELRQEGKVPTRDWFNHDR